MTLKGLTSQISALVAGFPGTTGIVIKDVNTGESMLINEHERFVAASIIKLPILWELFRQIEAGTINAGERIKLRESHKADGSGVLLELEAGLQPTIMDLATLMIILSDNTATNILIEMLGFENINHSIRSLGLETTILGRKMMDTKASQGGFENYVTASETAALLQTLLDSDALSLDSRSAMLDILKRQHYNDRLSANLPEGIPFAHKTGQLAGIEHDAGILFLANHRIIAVALTRQDGANKDGPQLCNDIGRLLYEHYTD